MPDISKKWLRVIGIGEDGWDDLTTDAKDLLYESEIVLGGERHLKMLPDDWEGKRIVWTSPIREAVSNIVSWRPKDPCKRSKNCDYGKWGSVMLWYCGQIVAAFAD